MYKVPYLFHFHIRKTGGTSINRYLDTLIEAERSTTSQRDPAFEDLVNNISLEDYAKSICDYIKNNSKRVYHNHTDLSIRLPEKYFCFTVLREPISRTYSQYSDIKRLNSIDSAAHLNFDIRALYSSIRNSKFIQVYEMYKDSRSFKLLFENHMCRTILQCELTYEEFNELSATDASTLAMEKLNEAFQFVGILENLESTLKQLCRILKVIPPLELFPKENRNQNPEKMTKREAALLSDINEADKMLYTIACSRFDDNFQYSMSRYYSVRSESFESEAARYIDAKEYHFNMNMPLVSTGFYGRDAESTPSCSVWSGPENTSLLTMPVATNIELEIYFDIRGWYSEEFIGDLMIEIDEIPTPFTYKQSFTNLHGKLVCIIKTSKLCITVKFVIKNFQASFTNILEQPDIRKRGFLLHGYGFRQKS